MRIYIDFFTMLEDEYLIWLFEKFLDYLEKEELDGEETEKNS